MTDEVAGGAKRERIARRFHSTVAEVVVRTCLRVREATQTRAVVLSGGTFVNTLLSREVDERLASLGFRVYRHRKVPCGDGGLCLGQLAVAAARDRCADDGVAPTEKSDVPRNTR
jgi:hydrogenase maturation protein HypF